MELLNDNKDEIGNNVVSYIKKEKKNVRNERSYSKLYFHFLKRESVASL